MENMESDISRTRTVFPRRHHGFGTDLRPLGIVMAFALLSFVVLGVANPFRSPLKIAAVLVAPLFSFSFCPVRCERCWLALEASPNTSRGIRACGCWFW